MLKLSKLLHLLWKFDSWASSWGVWWREFEFFGWVLKSLQNWARIYLLRNAKKYLSCKLWGWDKAKCWIMRWQQCNKFRWMLWLMLNWSWICLFRSTKSLLLQWNLREQNCRTSFLVRRMRWREHPGKWRLLNNLQTWTRIHLLEHYW